MPVFTVSENTRPHAGFSRKREIPPVLLGYDYAEVEGVFDAFEDHGHLGFLLLVEAPRPA